MSSIKSDILYLWNNPLDEFGSKCTKPARWCMRNLQTINQIEASTPGKKILERMEKIALAVFSAIALIFTLPIALIAMVHLNITIKKTSSPTNYEKNGLELDHQASAQKDLSTMSQEELDNDWKILDKIGHVRVINLDMHPKRFDGAVANLQEVGLKKNQIERFSAILGDHLPVSKTSRMDNNHKGYDPVKEKEKFEKLQKRQTGCYMSHYTIIKEAKAAHDKAMVECQALESELKSLDVQLAANPKDVKLKAKVLEKTKQVNTARENVRKYSSVLIVEDDNRMGRQTGDFKYSLKKVGLVFRKVMMDLPNDYHILFLVAYENKGSAVAGKKWIRKVNDFWDCNCYVVHSRFYQKYIDQLKKIDDDNAGKIRAVDRELPKCFPQNNVYIANPPLAIQGGCISTITQGGNLDPFDQRHRERWNDVVGRLVEA